MVISDPNSILSGQAKRVFFEDLFTVTNQDGTESTFNRRWVCVVAAKNSHVASIQFVYYGFPGQDRRRPPGGLGVKPRGGESVDIGLVAVALRRSRRIIKISTITTARPTTPAKPKKRGLKSSIPSLPCAPKKPSKISVKRLADRRRRKGPAVFIRSLTFFVWKMSRARGEINMARVTSLWTRISRLSVLRSLPE